MVRQTAISARIDNNTLWMIEQETMAGGPKRNRILNEGARMYLSITDARRAYRMHQDPAVRRKILNGMLKRWFPEAANWE